MESVEQQDPLIMFTPTEIRGPKLITFYLKSIRPNKLLGTIGCETRIVRGRRRVTLDTS